MNPRQRQGLLLVVIAAAGLVGVFVLIASYVSNVARQVGPKTHVLELSQAVSTYEPFSSNVLREVSIPEKWAPQNALTDPVQTQGLVAASSLPAGTYLQQGMLEPPPTLTAGQREIAILVDPETGVAGQIAPGDLVDIIATFQGNGQGTRNSAQVVVPSAKILQIGTPTTGGGSTSASSSGGGSAVSDQVIPVTFSLTPEQVLRVSYAESFAQKVRLSLVAPGSSGQPVTPPTYQPGR